jgi:hypothetical protein
VHRGEFRDHWARARENSGSCQERAARPSSDEQQRETPTRVLKEDVKPEANFGDDTEEGQCGQPSKID